MAQLTDYIGPAANPEDFLYTYLTLEFEYYADVDPIGSTRRLRHAEGVPRLSYVWYVRPAPPVYNSIGRSARAQAGYSLLS